MKKTKLVTLVVGLFVLSSTSFISCKDKKKDSTDTTITTSPAAEPAPVVVSADDELRKGVMDATKDHPSVNAEVKDGEITLTGELERDKLTPLMQTLQSLNPKKINQNLTIK